MSETTRISIFYGGAEYAVSGRTLEDVVAQIEAGALSDRPTWMDVRIGQGRSTPARILLGPAMPIAVWLVNTDGQPTPTEADGTFDPGSIHTE